LLTLWIACLLAIRNQRILATFDTRRAETTRRAPQTGQDQDHPGSPVIRPRSLRNVSVSDVNIGTGET
jgi:hypothetical protein